MSATQIARQNGWLDTGTYNVNVIKEVRRRNKFYWQIAMQQAMIRKYLASRLGELLGYQDT